MISHHRHHRHHHHHRHRHHRHHHPQPLAHEATNARSSSGDKNHLATDVLVEHLVVMMMTMMMMTAMLDDHEDSASHVISGSKGQRPCLG